MSAPTPFLRFDFDAVIPHRPAPPPIVEHIAGNFLIITQGDTIAMRRATLRDRIIALWRYLFPA